jgi:hypothetical protein
MMLTQTPINEVRPAFDRHHSLLVLLLGALSFSSQIEEFLCRPSVDGVDPMDPEHPLVIAALGSISLGRTIRRWAEEAASPAVECEQKKAPVTTDSLREFLR